MKTLKNVVLQLHIIFIQHLCLNSEILIYKNKKRRVWTDLLRPKLNAKLQYQVSEQISALK